MVNENQENFKKKKNITIICLSAALVFVTLIAGLFLVKKNKESRGNNDIGEVVDENDSDNENDNDNENVNEGDYFFNKTSGQIIENIILFLGVGILLFFWENDKNIKSLSYSLTSEFFSFFGKTIRILNPFLTVLKTVVAKKIWITFFMVIVIFVDLSVITFPKEMVY